MVQFKPTILEFGEDPLLQFMKTKQEKAYKAEVFRKQQESEMDNYMASILRDPNFSKDSPYNPYINDQLNKTLLEARQKYQSGQINASEFKYYVANKVSGLKLWANNSDQITKLIDDQIDYYKNKGADVSTLKSRAYREVFMKDGQWRDGASIAEDFKNGKFDNVVSRIVETNANDVFNDTKAIDDWLNTFKPEKTNVSEAKTVKRKSGGVETVSTGVDKGSADFYPEWQQIQKAGEVPIGVAPKPININSIKANDGVYYSAKAAVARERNITADQVNDDDVATWVTTYANVKRPYNFTKAERKADARVTYSTTINMPKEDNFVDNNIFNGVMAGTMPYDRYFVLDNRFPDRYFMKPDVAKRIKVGETKDKLGGTVPITVERLTMFPNSGVLWYKSSDGKERSLTAGTGDYEGFMSLLKVDNPWVGQIGSMQPEVKVGKGQKAGFGITGPKK